MLGQNVRKGIALFLIFVSALSLILIVVNYHQGQQNKKIHNLTWILPTTAAEYQNELTDPKILINKIKDQNIDAIAVYGGGWWNSDGTIRYDEGASFSIWTDFITVMKDWNPNIKILVWVTGWGETCDLRNSSIRTAMCNSAKQLLTAVPFDGWNEDYEGGSVYGVSYLLAFYDELLHTLKSMGKIATVALEVDWGGYKIEEVYPYLEGFDYVVPMFYSQIATDRATDYWNQILSNSSAPVLIGLAVDHEENGGISLSQQLEWIDKQSKHNLAGFALWSYDYMDDSDFTTFGHWYTKEKISQK